MSSVFAAVACVELGAVVGAELGAMVGKADGSASGVGDGRTASCVGVAAGAHAVASMTKSSAPTKAAAGLLDRIIFFPPKVRR